MNSLQFKLFNLSKLSGYCTRPLRACISTLQSDRSNKKWQFLWNQRCQRGIIRHAPLMYQQSRQMQLNYPPELNTKVTPLEVPGKGKLIYLGTIAARVKLLKMFSVSTSAVTLGLMPVIMKDLEIDSMLATIAVGTGLSFFIFMSPVLVHLFSKRYVTWIYYDEEINKFTASTYNFLAREVKHVFTPDDVEHHTHGFLTSVKVHDVPLLIDPSLFFDRSLYLKLMRFDRDDWILPDEELSEEATDVEKEVHTAIKDKGTKES